MYFWYPASGFEAILFLIILVFFIRWVLKSDKENKGDNDSEQKSYTMDISVDAENPDDIKFDVKKDSNGDLVVDVEGDLDDSAKLQVENNTDKKITINVNGSPRVISQKFSVGDD